MDNDHVCVKHNKYNILQITNGQIIIIKSSSPCGLLQTITDFKHKKRREYFLFTSIWKQTLGEVVPPLLIGLISSPVVLLKLLFVDYNDDEK